MLDFAKEKALWDNIRESEDFARHREEILAKYKESFTVEPSPHTVEEILGFISIAQLTATQAEIKEGK